MTRNPSIAKYISESLKLDIELSNKLRQMPEYRVHAGLHKFVDLLYLNAVTMGEDMKDD